MIEPLKKYLFNKQYQKVKRESKSYLKNKTNPLTSITILVDGEIYDVAAAEQAIAYFSNLGLDADAFVVVKMPVDHQNERVETINTKEDCHWYDVPRPEVLINWLQHKTDLLVIINPRQLRVIKYLCVSSNSLLKSAVVSDQGYNHNVDFCLEVNEISKTSLKDLVNTVYQELLKINKAVTV